MQTRTMMDEVADAIADLELGEKQARRLQEAMQNFQARAGRSLSLCKEMPGFRKLWDGLEEACRFALGPADMTDEEAVATQTVSAVVETTAQFKVSAAWMKSCGLSDEAKVFPVIRTQYLGSQAAAWCATMVIVDRDGREWMVAQGRGKFV